MGRGITDLRWAIASQSWRRMRTVAASVDDLLAPADEAGREPYIPRDVDIALETALGGDRTMIVATGERLAGSTRALAHAMRLMLGDRRLLYLHDPHHADLAELLGLARTIAGRDGPVVVVADDAPPALLDQITPATTALLDADVRLLLTTRQSWLDAFLAPETRALLDAATITVPALSASEAAGRLPEELIGSPLGAAVRPVATARRLLDPVSDAPLRRAILRAVIDWELLAVPVALTVDVLITVLRPYLPSVDEEQVRREVRRLLRHDTEGLRLLRRRRRPGPEQHLVADPVLSSLAEGEPALVDTPPRLGKVLRGTLSLPERHRVARVAHARGLDTVGLALTKGLRPDGLAPAAALQGARTRAAADAPAGKEVRAWFTWAIEHGSADQDVGRQARRELGLFEFERHRYDAAYSHLVEVADDDQHVQSLLATIAMEQSWPEADHWLALTAAGSNEPMASMAAVAAGKRALDRGELVDAEVFLLQGSTASDIAQRATALLLLAAISRRRGQLRTTTDRLRAVVDLGAPESTVQQAALDLAQLRREAKDVDGEVAALRAAIRSANPATFRAQVQLAEVEIGRERWTDVLDLLPADDDAFRNHRTDPGLRDRRAAARGEAAFQLGRWSKARRWYRELTHRTDRLGVLAQIRLGQCEIQLGDVLEGYRLLQAMRSSTETDLAELARTLAKPLKAEAHALAAQEAQAERIAARQAEAQRLAAREAAVIAFA